MPTVASTQRTVKLDGTELTPEIDGALESVLVVDRLAMPDMFTLAFRDPARDILGKAGIEIGKKVEISTGSLRDDAPEVLIEGEITSIEADYDRLGTRAVVRGYDRSHRLAAGRKTATFQDMSYSEIATKIAGDNGLTADCDDAGAALENTLQANVSDLDFLYGLARRIGFDCRVDGTTLLFKKPVESSVAPGEGDFESEDPLQLVWNANLLEFRARMSAVAQVAEVKVRGWDVKEKKAVIGKAEVTAPNAEISLTPKDLADKVGGETLLVVDHPVGTQELADGLALARAQQVGSAAFEATAVVLGDPSLKAGAAVNVSGIDPALEGKWVITGSRHEFGQSGYRTSLEFTGRQDRSIHGLVAQGSAATRERYYGVAVATVTDIDDPQQLARVKVMLPWLSEDVSTTWARLVAPGAGNGYGVMWMPQVGDEVLVAFEHGDIDYPVVLGGLWNGKDVPPFDYGSSIDSGSVTYCGFTSRTGHKVSFFESSSESKIHLLTANGKVSVELDDKNELIKVETTGKLVVDAQQDVEIKAGGSMKLEASGQMTIKGATVAIN
ncbi:MAG TPA: VgrG-related protein [Candidatus Limnocylindrales bacterium]|nr:VgrG-related protein [Candidatus Limnocylindrales bacterium]